MLVEGFCWSKATKRPLGIQTLKRPEFSACPPSHYIQLMLRHVKCLSQGHWLVGSQEMGQESWQAVLLCSPHYLGLGNSPFLEAQ